MFKLQNIYIPFDLFQGKFQIFRNQLQLFFCVQCVIKTLLFTMIT